MANVFFSRPITTIDNINFSIIGAPSAHEAIDDVVPDDSLSYIESPTGVFARLECGLSSVWTPPPGRRFYWRVRARRLGSDAGPDQLLLRLQEGLNILTNDLVANIDSNEWRSFTKEATLLAQPKSRLGLSVRLDYLPYGSNTIGQVTSVELIAGPVGISYAPLIRVVPSSGPVIVYDLESIATVTRAVPLYDRLSLDRDLVDRSLDEARLGYRVRVELAAMVPQAPDAAETALAAISAALSDPESQVEVSLGVDAFGAQLWRRVGRAEESRGFEQGPLSVETFAWSLIMAEPIPAPIAPGEGPVATW